MFDPAKADEREPFFTLLGRDPAAPHLLRSWAYRRCGQLALAKEEAAKADAVTVRTAPQKPGDPQIASAFEIADQMEKYLTMLTVTRANPKPPEFGV